MKINPGTDRIIIIKSNNCDDNNTCSTIWPTSNFAKVLCIAKNKVLEQRKILKYIENYISSEICSTVIVSTETQYKKYLIQLHNVMHFILISGIMVIILFLNENQPLKSFTFSTISFKVRFRNTESHHCRFLVVFDCEKKSCKYKFISKNLKISVYINIYVCIYIYCLLMLIFMFKLCIYIAFTLMPTVTLFFD